MKLGGRTSITRRLTVLFAVVSTTVLLLLGLIVAGLVQHHFEELDTEVLKGNLAFLQNALEKVRSAQELEGLPRQIEDALAVQPGLAVIIRAPDGRTLFATGRAEFPPSLLAPHQGRSARPAIWTTSDKRHFRGLAETATTQIAGAPPALVAAGTDMALHRNFMSSFHLALWSVVGFAALLTGLLGWVAANRGLAPLKTIRQSAAGITANRLDHRLSADSIPEELAQVVETLNDMLARLQESFRRLSDFSSDLAHELRTPVGNLLTETQVTLSKPRTPEQYRDLLASNGEELERLARMISDMLFLAKSDNDLIVPHREKIDLRREVEEVFEFYDALAAEKDVRLTLAGSGTVSGDRLMLRRAISNLLSNAIRHTPTGGQITVEVTETGDAAVILTVANTGDTIAAEHLSRLFDRFYRVHSSRQRFAEGAGLGLAITRSIVQAHGGAVSASSGAGVTRFCLRIPALPRVPPCR